MVLSCKRGTGTGGKGLLSGKNRAEAQGRRMSGEEAERRNDPSLNSTIPWTKESGQITASTLSAGREKRAMASRISIPLFISEALSTLILAPMLHTGWRTAMEGVTFSSSSGENVRKGPPDAVRTTRETEAGSLPARHCHTALCSLSRGLSCPFPADQRQHPPPRDHDALLVGQGNILAAPQGCHEGADSPGSGGCHDHMVDVGT
jgi:hypothetical protein